MNTPPIRFETPASIILEGVAMAGRAGGVDVRVEGRRIAVITPGDPAASSSWTVLPSPVNFHAHADRAFTAPAERSASLRDAVQRSIRDRAGFTRAEIGERARLFFERSIEHGAARVRTHTDVDGVVGLKSIEATLEAVVAVADRLSVDIIAFANAGNDLITEEARERVRTAIRLGASLVGSVPALSADPQRALDAALDLAAELGVEADLHLDEHLDASTALIDRAIAGVVARGLQGRVTFSHLCALSALSADGARRRLDGMAAANITLAAMPEVNLYLQDRGAGSPRSRGVAPLREACAAGVAVRLGTDNVRDWFFPLGDGDPLDTARTAVLGAHLEDPAELLPALCGGRSVLAVGDPADLLLIPAPSFDDALARRPAGRVSIRGGRVLTRPA